MFKSITTISLISCVSLFVTDQAMPASTYEIPGPAHAFMGGNDVHSWCQRARPMALAYTAGLWDFSARSVSLLYMLTGMAREEALDLAFERLGRFCEPDHVTLDQATDVFCAYLRDLPEKRNGPAAILFSHAMKRAWPCKKP